MKKSIKVAELKEIIITIIMENLFNVLRDSYNIAINQEEDWQFFTFLADYIKHSKEIPELRSILSNLEIKGKEYKEKYSVLYILSEERDNKLWEILEKLNLMAKVIFEGEKYFNKLQENNEGRKYFEKLLKEMEIIRNSGKNQDDPLDFALSFSSSHLLKKFSSSNDERIEEFKRDKYKLYFDKLHNYLIQELNKQRNRKEITKEKFSFKNRQLKYGDKNIIISKSKNTNPYFLLKILLENPKKEWAYDEIWDKLYGTKYEPKKWKKIYNTAYDLNEKVAKQTIINDLINIAKTTIKINLKYLN